MLCCRKNKSVVSFLRDRELHIKYEPNFLTIGAVNQLLRSRTRDIFDESDCPDGDFVFSKLWFETSKRPVSYDSGYLFFSDYTAYCPISGGLFKPPPRLKFEKSSARKRVSDMISYLSPVYKNIDCDCKRVSKRCICLSPYILTVTEDNWLCQHAIDKGKLVKEVYVNRIGRKFRFKYVDWVNYGDRVVLTSTLNPELPGPASKKTGAVVNIAVFTTFPLEFFALIEIKRSVFGEGCSHANVSDQLLIIGVGQSEVRIYSFDEFLREGNLTPYKIGDKYGDSGKVGAYPTGLPLNFSYKEAPPLLYRVNCRDQEIRFGGYPYHALTKTIKAQNYSLVNLANDTSAKMNVQFCDSNELFPEDTFEFHPDHSNRLVFKSEEHVRFFKLSSQNGHSKVSQLFTLGFLESNQQNTTYISSSGRIVRRIVQNTQSVLSVDYDPIFNVFVILGVYPHDPTNGFFRFYNNVTGDEIRTIKSQVLISETSFYNMFFDMGNIIVLERAMPLSYNVHVYNF